MSEYERKKYHQQKTNMFSHSSSNGVSNAAISNVGGGGGNSSSSLKYKTTKTLPSSLNTNTAYTTATLDEHQSKRSRLKKSFSECENDDDDHQSVELSPTKRKKPGSYSHHHHHNNGATTTKSNRNHIQTGNNLSNTNTSTNATIFDESMSSNNHLYQQQQYNNDMSPTFLEPSAVSTVTFSDKIHQIPTPDSYTSSQSGYTPEPSLIKHKLGSSSKLNSSMLSVRDSIRGSVGRSTLSLCSCDADTEIVPDPMRPLYQYSLDRKKPMHTYTCEQNAQILMRLERERGKKYGSAGKLNSTPSTKDNSMEFVSKPLKIEYPSYDDTDVTEDELTDADFIPPPPPPTLHRNPSFTRHYPCHSLTLTNQSNTGNKPNECTTSILNCTTNSSNITGGYPTNSGTGVGLHENNNNNLSSRIKNKITNTLNSNSHHQQQQQYHHHYHHQPNNNLELRPTTKPPDVCEFTSKNALPTSTKNETFNLGKSFDDPTTDISLMGDNGGGGVGAYTTSNKTGNYEYYFDENFIQRVPHNQSTTAPILNSLPQKENRSFFLYHHELPAYTPNYESHTSLANLPGKFNTIGPSSCRSTKSMNFDSTKCHHASTCNLDHSQFESNNLLNGRYFSNSLTNFNFVNPNRQFSSTLMPYTQFNELVGGDGPPVLGTTMIGSYDSMDSFGDLKGPTGEIQQQKRYPWKHQECPSRGSSSTATSSTRWDMPSRQWLAVTSILLIAGAAGVAVPLALRVTAGAPFEERLHAAIELLETVPLIDGHNDLPWNIRKFLHNQLNNFKFDENLRNVTPWGTSPWSHTDLERLKRGRLSAQFFAAYVPCEAQHRDAVQLTLEQIDVIKRLTDRYSPHMTTCTSAADIIEAHKNRQLCSFTGVEGGHSMGGSLGVLRIFYTIGVRLMTLTSTCHTPWADSNAADAPKFEVGHGGLTVFGKTIIREMNRLGMIVDLSHVSYGTMRDALTTSESPVIFSHSSAYALCNNTRNVQDDILELIAKNRGLVMVNFFSLFLTCSKNSTIHDAVAHINHIKRVAGIDHVGLGAGFDGINYVPKGLEDVSTYPILFAELLGDGWTVEELTKLAGQNFIRVMQEVEKVRDVQRKSGVKPYEDIPVFRIDDPYNCTTS